MSTTTGYIDGILPSGATLTSALGTLTGYKLVVKPGGSDCSVSNPFKGNLTVPAATLTTYAATATWTASTCTLAVTSGTLTNITYVL